MSTMFILSAALLLAIWFLVRRINRKYYILSLSRRVQTVDGSPLESKVFVHPCKTIFGNNLDILQMTPSKFIDYVADVQYVCILNYKRKSMVSSVNQFRTWLKHRLIYLLISDLIFKYMREANVKSKGESFLLYFLFCPMYNVVRAEDAEEIFQSTKLITKNVVYNLIKPFLGEGLLVSTGECNLTVICNGSKDNQ